MFALINNTNQLVNVSVIFDADKPKNWINIYFWPPISYDNNMRVIVNGFDTRVMFTITSQELTTGTNSKHQRITWPGLYWKLIEFLHIIWDMWHMRVSTNLPKVTWLMCVRLHAQDVFQSSQMIGSLRMILQFLTDLHNIVKPFGYVYRFKHLITLVWDRINSIIRSRY